MKNKLDEDKNKLLECLNKPHPAQVIGIMRILGVGYDPDEKEFKNVSEVKLNEEAKKHAPNPDFKVKQMA